MPTRTFQLPTKASATIAGSPRSITRLTIDTFNFPQIVDSPTSAVSFSSSLFNPGTLNLASLGRPRPALPYGKWDGEAHCCFHCWSYW
ncbi:Hypothetical predicted protein [Olea europaea subsp. europaea]|uniref:Uncharacterized protein n=2 Tax=Olea europaea subsp. europaea TaxID=158383 RepID=A0A8S0SMY0_OLEEU|nr:Hypothetical predicted protein [Olea europaea subsp. europaea]